MGGFLIPIGISLLTAFFSVLGEVLLLARTEVTESTQSRLIKPSEIWHRVRAFGPRLCLIALGANMAIARYHFQGNASSAEPFFWLAIASVILWIVTLVMVLFQLGRHWLGNIAGFALTPRHGHVSRRYRYTAYCFNNSLTSGEVQPAPYAGFLFCRQRAGGYPQRLRVPSVVQ